MSVKKTTLSCLTTKGAADSKNEPDIVIRKSDPKVNSRINAFKRLISESKKCGYRVRNLGNVGGFPIIILVPSTKRPKNVLVSTAFHGEEPAGFYAIIKEMASVKSYRNLNVSFLPLPNPVGFFKGQRKGVSDKEPNRGFCKVDDDKTEKDNEPTDEGKILLRHKKELLELGRDGFLSMHEDSESANSYVFTFENGSRPGRFSKELLESLRKYFPKKGNPTSIEYKVHDGSFEDMMSKLGVPYSACTETPSHEDFDKRVDANKSVLHAFLRFINLTTMKNAANDLDSPRPIKVVLSFLEKRAAHTVTEDRKSKEDMATQTRAVEKLLKDVVTKTLPEYKGKVYSVGGHVRDKLLGSNPKDIDLVIDSPEDGMKSAEIFAKKLAGALGITTSNNPSPLKEQYGIWGLALVNPRNNQDPFIYDGVDVSGYVLEMTPPRLEGPYIKGRGPAYVKYTTLEDDAKRRDLTVNALYQDVASGEIKDFVGGLDDIKNKILRPPSHPDGIKQIYVDDPLRILRLVRFKGKLPGFQIDPATNDFLMNFARTQEGREIIREKVKPERIREELDKILKHPDGNVAADGLDLIREMGLLDLISPNFSKMLEIYHDDTRKYHHGESVWEHTLNVLRKTPGSLHARLGALFHDIGKVLTEKRHTTKEGKPAIMFPEHAEYGVDLAKRALRELKYPLDVIDSVSKIVHSHMLFTEKDKSLEDRLKKLRVFLQYVYDDLDDALAVIEADQAIDPEESKRIESLKSEIKKLKEDDIRKGLLVTKGGKYKYADPMTGDEIMAERSEVTRGPVIGEIQQRLKRMLLRGHFDNMDEKQRAQEARRILNNMAARKGWEKSLEHEVRQRLENESKRRKEYETSGLPAKAVKLMDLV